MSKTDTFFGSSRIDGLKGKRLLTIEQTAILLGISRSALCRAVRIGATPFKVYKIGGQQYVPRAAVTGSLTGGELGKQPELA